MYVLHISGEASPSRREAVKRKTAEYLMRAELISGQLKDSMGQSSTQSRVSVCEIVSGYVCNHGSPNGERDTASPRGRYGERPQRDSV